MRDYEAELDNLHEDYLNVCHDLDEAERHVEELTDALSSIADFFMTQSKAIDELVSGWTR